MKKVIVLFLLFMTVACAQKFATKAEFDITKTEVEALYQNGVTGDLISGWDFTNTDEWQPGTYNASQDSNSFTGNNAFGAGMTWIPPLIQGGKYICRVAGSTTSPTFSVYSNNVLSTATTGSFDITVVFTITGADEQLGIGASGTGVTTITTFELYETLSSKVQALAVNDSVVYRTLMTDVLTTPKFNNVTVWTPETYVATTPSTIYGFWTNGVVNTTALEDKTSYELVVELSGSAVGISIGTATTYGTILNYGGGTLDTVITFNTGDIANNAKLAVRPYTTGTVTVSRFILRKIGIPHSTGVLGGGEYHLSQSQYQGIVALLQQATVDTIPDPSFAFTDTTGVVETRDYSSEWITLAGYDSTTASITGGSYRTSALDTWHTADSTISSDSIQVKGTASSSQATAVNVVLTVGGLSDTYTITTRATKYLYFSSTEGDNANDGLDSANAKADVSLIETYTSVPSGTIFNLQRGSTFTTFSNTNYEFPSNDEARILLTPRSNITIRDYGVGAKPILDCQGDTTNGLFITKDSVNVYNLDIVDMVQWDSTYPTHYTYRLVHVWDAINVTLDSVDLDAEATGYIHRASMAYVGFDSDDFTWKNSELTGSYEHAIYFGKADRWVVEYNNIHSNKRAGMVENRGGDGGYNDSCIVRYNTFRDNQKFVALRSYNTKDLNFYYNLIVFPTDSVVSLDGDDNYDEPLIEKKESIGIQFSVTSASTDGVIDARIFNNTFVLHADTTLDTQIKFMDSYSYDNSELSADIFNNIFYKIHITGYQHRVYHYNPLTDLNLNFYNNMYYQAAAPYSQEWLYVKDSDGSGGADAVFYPYNDISEWQDGTTGFNAIAKGTGNTTDDNSFFWAFSDFVSFSNDVTDTASNDYRLDDGSLPVDLGFAHSIVTDILGNTVPIGARVDAGAYENQTP